MRQLDHRIDIVVGDKITTNLLLIAATIEHTRKLDNGTGARLAEVVEHVHREGKVGSTLRSQYACRSIARIVDEDGVVLAVPFERIGRIGYDGIERTSIELQRVVERVAQLDVEVVVVDVVKEHVDAAQVVGRGIDLLSEVLQLGIALPDGLGEFEQQGARTACRVIDLADVGIAHLGDACQHVAHLLGRKELSTRLARVAGIHLHQIFVGIAEGVDLVVFEVLAKPHVAHRNEHVGKELVA